MHVSLQPEAGSETCFRRFEKERVLERLRSLERRWLADGLGALDPRQEPLISIGTEINSSGRVTKYSYGVFSLSSQARLHPEWPDRIEKEIHEIHSRIEQAHNSRLRFLIWAGMGGSAEDKSMYDAMGLLRRGVRCYVLDSTDPAKLKCILSHMTRRLSPAKALRSTLVVGMAAGMTSYEPVLNLRKLTALFDRSGIDSRANFVYMTFPGSLLDKFAGPRGYRRIDLQPDGLNTTAGRHTGPLTRGSLYPLALADTDLRKWVRGTFLREPEIYSAWRLSAFIHANAEAGRDKVTLFLPRAWRGVAIWTKQDFEESLGKSESSGLKIIVGEQPNRAYYRAAGDPRQDRVFLSLETEDTLRKSRAAISSLRNSGYPAAVLAIPAGTVLSRYMQFVHYVVFGIAYLREMNFVTQPSVELYKAIASRLYVEAERRGTPLETGAWKSMSRSPRQATWRGLTLMYDGIDVGIPAEGDAPDLYARLVGPLLRARRIEYAELTFFGDTRYCPTGRKVRSILDRWGDRLFRRMLKVPVDIYEGPAMNHSYHEMIIGHGKCFSTILVSARQERIEAVNYNGDYHFTQFLATKLALEERKRPVVALILKDLGKRCLADLEAFFERACEAAHRLNSVRTMSPDDS